MKTIKHIILIIFFVTNTMNLISAEAGSSESRTTIGAYGELHYNYSEPEGEDPAKKLDFHRFVLFLSHSFSERWSFKAEVELEHNFVKDGHGELELEQAYIDYYGAEYFGFQAGVVLVSAGLINEKHEPPLFMSVERPDYAKYIIPTTWFGNGLALYGSHKGFDYKLTVMEGLDGEKIDLDSGIRGGRQKGFKADADALLFNFRLNYTGLPGLLTGLSYTYNEPKIGDGNSIPIRIMEFHFKYDNHNIYSAFETGNINYGNGSLETSSGYYFDLGYNIGSLFHISSAVYPWFRWTEYNTASKIREIGIDPNDYKVSKWLVGVTVKPIPDIVFKVEYGIQKSGSERSETKLFNLGIGYMF